MTDETREDLSAIINTDRNDSASLYRSAEYFERRGMPATARLFRNAAFMAARREEERAQS